MAKRWVSASVIGWLLVAAGCGPVPAPQKIVCSAGATQSCVCPTGSGVQTCAADETTWEPCQCPRVTNPCGDGVCAATESCSSCPIDCGSCQSSAQCGQASTFTVSCAGGFKCPTNGVCASSGCACATGYEAVDCSGQACTGNCTAPNWWCVPASTTASCRASLAVTPTAQYCSEWCWTAALTMIDDYFGATYNGQPASECEFESSLTGYPCCNYAACSYSMCNQPAGSGQVLDYYLNLFGVHGNDLNGYLTEAQLQQELLGGRPFIVRFQGPSLDHVVVVSGFDACAGQALYHVIDPYFGPQDIPYAEFGSYGPNRDGVWIETWYGLTH